MTTTVYQGLSVEPNRLDWALRCPSKSARTVSSLHRRASALGTKPHLLHRHHPAAELDRSVGHLRRQVSKQAFPFRYRLESRNTSYLAHAWDIQSRCLEPGQPENYVYTKHVQPPHRSQTKAKTMQQSLLPYRGGYAPPPCWRRIVRLRLPIRLCRRVSYRGGYCTIYRSCSSRRWCIPRHGWWWCIRSHRWGRGVTNNRWSGGRVHTWCGGGISSRYIPRRQIVRRCSARIPDQKP